MYVIEPPEVVVALLNVVPREGKPDTVGGNRILALFHQPESTFSGRSNYEYYWKKCTSQLFLCRETARQAPPPVVLRRAAVEEVAGQDGGHPGRVEEQVHRGHQGECI